MRKYEGALARLILIAFMTNLVKQFKREGVISSPQGQPANT